MADVFLSYARPDAAVAERIARKLHDAGRSVWFDNDLPAHRAYSEVIERELDAAKSVIVLWSKAAIASQWVRSEANRARELGKLVQARLDGARLPMPFDQIQCADLSRWRSGATHAGWSQVERSVAALIGGSEENGEPRHQPRSPVSRRQAIAGAAAILGLSAAGGIGWHLISTKRSAPGISPATQALMGQAKIALWQNTREGQNQAIAMYRQVVDENPSFAEAWGRLAMAYAWTSHWRSSAEGGTMQERARSAAQQALALDPRDAHALVAMACATIYLGHWLDVEKALQKAIDVAPSDQEVAFSRAFLASSVGLNRDASDFMKLALPDSPTPGTYVFYAQMLWGAGRQEQLDHVLDEASKLYPTHLGIWFTRFYTAMMGGRVSEALALGADTANWPTGVPADEIQSVIRVAKAIDSRSPADVDAVTSEWMKRAHEGAGYAENAAQFLTALGRNDQAFAVLRAYFFSQGFDCGENRFGGTQGTFTPRNDRLTGFLFNPALAPLRRDERFTKLMNDLKFSDYWRRSGRSPDWLGGR